MGKTAADVMQSFVIALSPQDTLLDAHRIFVEEEIHGAPVVDEEGAVVGVVTSTDLMRAVSAEHESAGFSPAPELLEGLEFGSPIWRVPDDLRDQLARVQIGEVMTKEVCSVAEGELVSEVAARMHRQRIHRVWVMKEGRPIGVVSAFDLLPLVRDQ